MNFPIIISSVNELVRVYPERIVYISSDSNCTLYGGNNPIFV